MNEYLLKAITRLFAIVAKENVGDVERDKISTFISRQVNQEEAQEYLWIFDEFSKKRVSDAGEGPSFERDLTLDTNTEEFVEDWASVILICKRINKELTYYLKLVLIARLLELIHTEGALTERQENLIFYISKAINVSIHDVKLIKAFIFAQDEQELNNENILIADDGSQEDYKQCKHILRPNITGFLAILYLPSVEGYFVRYVGISQLRLNGIPLRSRVFEIFPSGSNIRGDKIKPIYYSDVVSRFRVTESTPRLSLTSSNISVKFRRGRIGLRDIHINEESGKLVGIMGASGSGKSTLLEVLNGKIKPLTGNVTINGIDVHHNQGELEGLIGYVPQDDLLIEDLTVFENLYYAARLSLANMSEHELTVRVDEVLRSLGILDIKELKVGNPLKKTISGGQRKRLNIALELLREPAVLFVDEPTSGLSSRDSEIIMDLLKELALKGKLVFVTIHQPSSDIFKMFDSLIILDVGGFQIYYGNPLEAVVYFREIVNMVQRDQGLCFTCGNVKIEQIFNIIEDRAVNEYGQLTNNRRILPSEWSEHFKKRHSFREKRHPYSLLPENTFKIPGRLEQLFIFSRRDLLAKIKNLQYVVINLLEAPALALIIGYFMRYLDRSRGDQSEYSFYENGNIPTYFFISIIVALFMGLSVSGEEIIKDRRILAREKFLNLSRGSYLISKMGILFAISAVQMLAFVLIGNMLLELRGMNLAHWLVLFSCACFANAIGLNISSGFNSVVTIYILVPIILIPQLLFNGIVIDFDQLNPAIRKEGRVPFLGDLMASKWAYEGIMVYQFKNNPYESYFYEWDKELANNEYKYTYLIPTLQSQLEQTLPAIRGKEPAEDMRRYLDLVHAELKKELKSVGQKEADALVMLQVSHFDSAAYASTTNMLQTLRQYYVNRYNKVLEQKDSMVSGWLRTKEKQMYMSRMRQAYKNERISELVRNSLNPTRILLADGRLVRKVDPVYQDPEIPKNALDFRSHFYAPRKYFLGLYFETFWFNMAVIWLMTVLAALALYYKVLKKTVNAIERMGNNRLPQYVKANQYLLRKRLGK
jgi:ABC-type multidrug transport system ATPase subunit